MLTIHKPTITYANGKARLSADITVDGETKALWYEVEEEYGQYLCHERGDAFLVGLLRFAMMGHHDIESEAPLTDELKRQIETDYIPAVVNENRTTIVPIRILAPTAPALAKNGNAVGASLSCGVDSLYTILTHERDITHFVVNNCHGGIDEKAREIVFDCLVARAKKFTSLYTDPAGGGKALIVGDTNFDGGTFPGVVFEGNTSHGNCFAAFALQKLFRIYYMATGYALRDFIPTSDYCSTDPAHYDLLLGYAWSFSTFRLAADGFVTRLEKVRALSGWDKAHKSLDVCHVHNPKNGDRNGTYDCPKCMRTCLELLAVGGVAALEKFSSVFDVEYVKAHREEYLAELLRGRLHGDAFTMEMWSHRGLMGFTTKDYFNAIPIVLRKLIKKVLRRGKTSHSFTPRG